VVFTPLTYLIVNGLKKAEDVDVFDLDTNFTPFSLKDDGKVEKPALGD
jgi:hypothetical protein